MSNQVPKIGRIYPTFTDPQDEQYQTDMGQSQYHPNAGHQVPRGNLNPSGYLIQTYGAPGGPQGPYTQQPLPGMSAYPQAAFVSNKGDNVQPIVFVTPMPMAVPVPDYMCYSIFTMLFCCLPLGIAATIYSCNTQSANRAGQQELAKNNSRVAFILNNVALGIGLAATAVYIIIILAQR